MNSSLSISRSGLKGLQTHLDITSNNIANVNTIGFKQKNTNFYELLRNDVAGQNGPLPNGVSRGMKATQGQFNMTQGSLIASNNPFDLAISGEGMFGIRLPDNQLAYTRDGSFAFDQNGVLRNASGNRVEMTLNVPKNNWPKGEPYVREDGQVRVGNILVGEIPVFDDANSSQLIEVGENQWVLPQGQAATRLANPVIKQHFLEGSNVELAESMSDMIVTQRAYSMNAKVLQATDEMMQRINEYKQ